MNQKMDNCHQLEWVRGYLDSAIHRNKVALSLAPTKEDKQYFEGSKHALEVLLNSINDVFEGGSK